MLHSVVRWAFGVAYTKQLINRLYTNVRFFITTNFFFRSTGVNSGWMERETPLIT